MVILKKSSLFLGKEVSSGINPYAIDYDVCLDEENELNRVCSNNSKPF